MRISDWSSDVCSSDLHWLRRRAGRSNKQVFSCDKVFLSVANTLSHLPAHGEKRRIIIESKGLLCYQPQSPNYKSMWSPDLTLLPVLNIMFINADFSLRAVVASQIGRASCRERVCQYV